MTGAAQRLEALSGSALELNLRALRPILSDPEVTELCINRPRRGLRRDPPGLGARPLPFADFDWCRRLAKLVANSTRQRIDEATPAPVRLAPERRAHPDRPAAGDHAGHRGDHAPPAVG